MGVKSSPGHMRSYRGYYDQLAIDPDGREPKSIAEVLKEITSTRQKGIVGDGGRTRSSPTRCLGGPRPGRAATPLRCPRRRRGRRHHDRGA